MRFLGFRFSFGCLFPAATTVCCAICTEPVPSASSFKATALCKHSFCRSCLSSYITTSIGDGVVNVLCPGLHCRARLDPHRCKELVMTESFLAWCDLLCESYVLGLARCYRPNLNCGEVIVNECGRKGNVKRFECPRCHRSGCFQCGAVWTSGHQCGSRQDGDLRLLKMLIKISFGLIDILIDMVEDIVWAD
ncbi:E3 ubiquitin-protein ligase RNF217-like [Rhodamnia argentea]|uniref:E3 ubiquitin-protein ligase RNF217-like n=1 Tax=Rhodamnia argentea TaxID=178133 RepID=A0ABM3GXY4_9MYRT|nr:E3 ubiquitin-protein ligase RNF217-like [Rhodamnia argentea]